jgi:Uma2 family endonuclease
MPSATKILTAEEFFWLPSSDKFEELVRGKVVTEDLRGFLHGAVCAHVGYVFASFLDAHNLGHGILGNSGVITERGPDTVRGPDFAYYSFARMPRGKAPVGYPSVAPEVVFEVYSPSESWPELLAKTAEYLKAGVLVVVLCDPGNETLHVYRNNSPPISLTANDTLELPEVDEEFRILASRFFESS